MGNLGGPVKDTLFIFVDFLLSTRDDIGAEAGGRSFLGAIGAGAIVALRLNLVLVASADVANWSLTVVEKADGARHDAWGFTWLAGQTSHLQGLVSKLIQLRINVIG